MTENRTWVDNTADQKTEEFVSLLIVFLIKNSLHILSNQLRNHKEKITIFI